jgi:hypothetical protein
MILVSSRRRPEMSDRRFQSTELGLGECQEALEEQLNGEAAAGLSPEELRAAERLLGRCIDLVGVLADALGVEFDAGALDRPSRIRRLLAGEGN